MLPFPPASLAELVRQICASPPVGTMTTRLVAIDGPGGAGKSTLATRLAEVLDSAPVIHTDDFASWENPLNWWPRLLQQVLVPLSQNEPARYQRYDWPTAHLAEWHEVGPRAFIVLEGVTALREVFRPYLAFRIWVETPRAVRLRRGLARDGVEAAPQWAEWMAQEDKYVAQENPRQWADAVVAGTTEAA